MTPVRMSSCPKHCAHFHIWDNTASQVWVEGVQGLIVDDLATLQLDV